MVAHEMSKAYYDTLVQLLEENRTENQDNPHMLNKTEKLLFLLTNASDVSEVDGETYITMEWYMRTYNDLLDNVMQGLCRMAIENSQLKERIYELERKNKLNG